MRVAGAGQQEPLRRAAERSSCVGRQLAVRRVAGHAAGRQELLCQRSCFGRQQPSGRSRCCGRRSRYTVQQEPLRWAEGAGQQETRALGDSGGTPFGKIPRCGT